MTNIGTIIAERRNALGISQERLSAAANLSRQNLSRIETGDVSPNLATITRILTALRLKITVDET